MSERSASAAWPYLLAAVAAAAVHLLAWDASYATFSRSVDFNDGALEDFVGFYLPQGRTILESGRPVEGFFYSPSFALLLAPLSALDPGVASWIWLALELVTTAALIAAGLAAARPRPRWLGPAYVFAALVSFPLAHNLHWGQVSVLLALLVVLAAAADVRGGTYMAAACIGLAAAVKFYPALFLLVFVVREDWRPAWIGAASALLLLVAVPAAVLGPGATIDFYRSVLGGLERAEASSGLWAEAWNRQVLPAVLARWTGAGGRWAVLGFAALGWLLAAAVLVLARRAPARGTPEGRALAFVAVALSLPLVVGPSWPHYFALLPFAWIVLAAAGRDDRLVLALTGASALLASVPFFRLVGDPESYGRAGWLLVADAALIAALARVVLRPARAPQPSSSSSSSSPA